MIFLLSVWNRRKGSLCSDSSSMQNQWDQAHSRVFLSLYSCLPPRQPFSVAMAIRSVAMATMLCCHGSPFCCRGNHVYYMASIIVLCYHGRMCLHACWCEWLFIHSYFVVSLLETLLCMINPNCYDRLISTVARRVIAMTSAQLITKPNAIFQNV